MRKEYDLSDAKPLEEFPHYAKLQAALKGKSRITIMLDNFVIDSFKKMAKVEGILFVEVYDTNETREFLIRVFEKRKHRMISTNQQRSSRGLSEVRRRMIFFLETYRITIHITECQVFDGVSEKGRDSHEAFEFVERER